MPWPTPAVGPSTSPITRQRLQAENDHFKQQIALLDEEIQIKDARMMQIAPEKRPHYAPTE